MFIVKTCDEWVEKQWQSLKNWWKNVKENFSDARTISDCTLACCKPITDLILLPFKILDWPIKWIIEPILEAGLDVAGLIFIGLEGWFGKKTTIEPNASLSNISTKITMFAIIMPVWVMRLIYHFTGYLKQKSQNKLKKDGRLNYEWRITAKLSTIVHNGLGELFNGLYNANKTWVSSFVTGAAFLYFGASKLLIKWIIWPISFTAGCVMWARYHLKNTEEAYNNTKKEIKELDKVKPKSISLTGVLDDRKFVNYCEKNGPQNCWATLFPCCQKKKSEQDLEYRLIEKKSYNTL